MRNSKKNNTQIAKIAPPITVRSNEQLANTIKRIRKLQGLSQTELAKSWPYPSNNI